MAWNKKRTTAWLLAALMAAGVMLAGCDSEEKAVTPPEKIESAQQEVAIPDDVIPTPCGELTFPGMWKEHVSFEIEEEGEDYRVTFTGTSDGVEAKLFTLCFGSVPERAYVMGSFEQMQVSILMHTIEPQQDWPEGAYDALCSLQESQNDLLIQLQQLPGFSTTG